MNHHVTPRSIAYTATQVRVLFLLSFRLFLIFPPPSSSFHLALHVNGSVNTTGSTIHHSTTLSLTFLKMLKTMRHRRTPLMFLPGGISKSYWGYMEDQYANIRVVLGKFSPLYLAGVVKVPGTCSDHQ
jgi:hypothetical protein